MALKLNAIDKAAVTIVLKYKERSLNVRNRETYLWAKPRLRKKGMRARWRIKLPMVEFITWHCLHLFSWILWKRRKKLPLFYLKRLNIMDSLILFNIYFFTVSGFSSIVFPLVSPQVSYIYLIKLRLYSRNMQWSCIVDCAIMFVNCFLNSHFDHLTPKISDGMNPVCCGLVKLQYWRKSFSNEYRVLKFSFLDSRLSSLYCISSLLKQ